MLYETLNILQYTEKHSINSELAEHEHPRITVQRIQNINVQDGLRNSNISNNM
jgi:hypothetical protein